MNPRRRRVRRLARKDRKKPWRRFFRSLIYAWQSEPFYSSAYNFRWNLG